MSPDITPGFERKKGKPFKIFKVTILRNKILAAKAGIILLSRLQIQFCFSGQKLKYKASGTGYGKSRASF